MMAGTHAIRQDADGLWLNPVTISVKDANGALEAQTLTPTLGSLANVAMQMLQYEANSDNGKTEHMNRGHPHLPLLAPDYVILLDIHWMSLRLRRRRTQMLLKQHLHPESGADVDLSLRKMQKFSTMRDQPGLNGTWAKPFEAYDPARELLSAGH
jgi:hypothetical protein